MASRTPGLDSSSTWWIDRGVAVALPKAISEQPFSDLDLPYRVFRLVHVRSSARRMVIRWDVDHADEPSLDTASNIIDTCSISVRLEFFKDGWAFEDYENPEDAAFRFAQLREFRGAKIGRLAVIEPRDPRNVSAMAPLLRRAVRSGGAGLEFHQLFYEFNDQLDDFVLTMAGDGSGLTQAMGKEWVAQALGTPHSPNQPDDYDRTVVPPYFDVMHSGREHYDHVVASVTPPGHEQVWTPYERLIQPLLRDGKATGVRITCQLVPQRIPMFEA